MKNIIQKYKLLFSSALQRDTNPTALLTGFIVACGGLWVLAVLTSLIGQITSASAIMDIAALPFVALFILFAIAYPILTLMNLKNAENNESYWMNLIVATLWGGLIAVSIFLTVSGVTV